MSVTAPKGFVAGGVACGIKESGALDLALVAAEAPVPAAGVFTRNLAAAPPVIVSRRHVAGGRIRAVVISSGCANAATGEAGREAAEATAREVATRLGCLPGEVVVCSTGPIGGLVPVDRIADGLDAMELTTGGADSAARAILTTDSHAKQQVRTTGGFTVGGMAKGAGMIRPDMATMLAVITTDAVADPLQLDEALRRAVDRSFNALDIDGCESTNDTVVILASGASGVTPDPSVLAGAIEDVCRGLAAQMAADAEGASKVVTLELGGAPDDDDALRLARAVADSALVRASFYGADPNWGRVLAALGSARVHFDLDEVEIDYAGTTVARGGVDLGEDHDAISAKLRGDFTVTISVGPGPGRCSLLTTDLTPEYVRFNGERS
jgi:glutamate N-acetyltransferase/amino-acid N-acetyltransferase